MKDLGERLVEASNKAKASDIEYKLAKLDDQWQQLLDLREARLVLSKSISTLFLHDLGKLCTIYHHTDCRHRSRLRSIVIC